MSKWLQIEINRCQDCPYLRDVKIPSYGGACGPSKLVCRHPKVSSIDIDNCLIIHDFCPLYNKEKPLPSWWPQNPYPEDVFPMTIEDYVHLIPDPDKRTALTGCMGRFFYEMLSGYIWRSLQAHFNHDE